MFSFLGHYPLPKDVSTPQFAKVIQAVSLLKASPTSLWMFWARKPRIPSSLAIRIVPSIRFRRSVPAGVWQRIIASEDEISRSFLCLNPSRHPRIHFGRRINCKVIQSWKRAVDSLSCAKRKFALMGLLQRGLTKKHAAHSRSNWLLSNRVCNGTHPSHPSISIVKALDQPRDGVPMKNFWASRKVTNPFPSPEHLGQKKTLVEEIKTISLAMWTIPNPMRLKKVPRFVSFRFFSRLGESNFKSWIVSLLPQLQLDPSPSLTRYLTWWDTEIEAVTDTIF